MENKFKIIETEDYVLAVSDEEIEKWYLDDVGTVRKGVTWDKEYWSVRKDYKKIIAYKPKNNAFELDLPLLPEIVVEDDVEKFDKIITEESEYWYKATGSLTSVEIVKKAFSMGLKSATKIYSKQDLMKAIKMARQYSNDVAGFADEEIIQSFKTHTPKWFVAEMEEECGYSTNGYYSNIVLKTTTINGKTYLLGTYLFE